MSEHPLNLALDISLTVNGERVTERVEARKTLVDFLREDLGLTGSHVGCEHGVCGACTVRVNGEIVRGCLMLAVQCDGATVETIEGLSDSGEVADLQAAFEQRPQAAPHVSGLLVLELDPVFRFVVQRDVVNQHFVQVAAGIIAGIGRLPAILVKLVQAALQQIKVDYDSLRRILCLAQLVLLLIVQVGSALGAELQPGDGG